MLWSFAMIEVLANNYPHRIFDVRRWPVELSRPAVAQLVAAFVDGRLARASGPTTVFVGSSFTFGYPWQESAIMSKRYAETHSGETVINVSVIGAGFEVLNRGILCGIAAAAPRIDLAIVEIPVVNAVSRIAEGEGSDWIDSCPPLQRRANYLKFALARPVGIGWVPFIWDTYAYDKTDESVALAPVRKGYFADSARYSAIRDRYRDAVSATVLRARSLAANVAIVPSPVFLTGAAELHEDVAAIRAQLDDTIAVCRSFRDVTCVDVSQFYDRREVYYNMTHLNQRGHQVMAEWLNASIPRQE